MLGNGRTTQTINELIIDSLEKQLRPDSWRQIISFRTPLLRTRRAAGSTLGSRQLARPFSEKHAASLPRHFCDEGRHGAARNQPLRENAEFIYKTGYHQSAAVRQRIQRFTHDVLGRLINEAKLSIAVCSFPRVAIGKNPAGAECDHTHSARSEFFLKPQRKTC